MFTSNNLIIEKMTCRTKKMIRCLGIILSVGWIQSGCIAQDITVMSYNIRYASPNDGPNLWQNRKDDMIQTLLEIKPNLIGLQEVVLVATDGNRSTTQEYSIKVANNNVITINCSDLVDISQNVKLDEVVSILYDDSLYNSLDLILLEMTLILYKMVF